MIKLEEIDNIKNLQFKEINNTLNKIINDKTELNKIIEKSAQIRLDSLIEETKIVSKKIEVSDNSITDQEKSQLLDKLYKSWLDLRRHHEHIPEAIELIRSIDNIKHTFSRYQKYFLGRSLINEKKVGDEETNLKKAVNEFQLLSETIDVFIDCFPVSDLRRTYQDVQDSLDKTTRTSKEYLENTPENSSLITELRAYCSLIILRIKKYLTEIETSKSLTTWDNAINQINNGNINQEKISQLFQSWAKLDDEIEQKETLKIIESLGDIADTKFLEYLTLENISSSSQLTQEQAKQLADEIDQKIWASIKDRVLGE